MVVETVSHVTTRTLIAATASVAGICKDHSFGYSALITYHHHQRLHVLRNRMAGLFWIAGATIMYGKTVNGF